MKPLRSRASLLLLLCLLFNTVYITSGNAEGNGVAAREILRMHTDGLSEQVLLEHLNLNGFDGQLTNERVQALRQANVPRSVIRRMRQLQERRSNRDRQQHGGHASDRRTVTKDRFEEVDQNQVGNGVMKLSSRTSDPVWFRIDRSSRTLFFSTEDERQFVGLSKGNRIQFPVNSGTWHVSLNESTRARQFTIPAGDETKIVVRERQRERIVLQLFETSANEHGQRIVLKAGRTVISERIRNRRGRLTGRSGQNRVRLSSRSVGVASTSIYNRSGSYKRGYRFQSPHLTYLRVQPVRWSFYGFRGLEALRTKRHHGSLHRRGTVFDFHINLNHDFGKGQIRGSFHLKDGRRNLHIHSTHSD